MNSLGNKQIRTVKLRLMCVDFEHREARCPASKMWPACNTDHEGPFGAWNRDLISAKDRDGPGVHPQTTEQPCEPLNSNWSWNK